MNTLPRTILPGLKANSIVYSITNPLHYTTGIPSCNPGQGREPCAMCTNAVRLVLQHVEPAIIDAVLGKIGHAVGRPNLDPHPQFCGDD